MRIVFFHSDKPREVMLAEAFASGARAHGDTVELRALTPDHAPADNCDVACMVGVKSKELFWNHWRNGVHTIYFDKGYTRHTVPGPIKIWEYWRVSVDAHNPTKCLEEINRPSDRADKLGVSAKPWRSKGESVIFAGSSEKYHNFYGLSDPTRYAVKVVGHLKRLTGREIIYRPKPSWRDAKPIPNATYSSMDQTIEDVLSRAHVMITHGSNACYEAVLYGVPCIVLGEAVAKSISSNKLEHVESPRLASDKERHQWLSNLMYCQWKLPEMLSGEAWHYIRPQVFGY